MFVVVISLPFVQSDKICFLKFVYSFVQIHAMVEFLIVINFNFDDAVGAMLIWMLGILFVSLVVVRYFGIYAFL